MLKLSKEAQKTKTPKHLSLFQEEEEDDGDEVTIVGGIGEVGEEEKEEEDKEEEDDGDEVTIVGVGEEKKETEEKEVRPQKKDNFDLNGEYLIPLGIVRSFYSPGGESHYAAVVRMDKIMDRVVYFDGLDDFDICNHRDFHQCLKSDVTHFIVLVGFVLWSPICYLFYMWIIRINDSFNGTINVNDI